MSLDPPNFRHGSTWFRTDQNGNMLEGLYWDAGAERWLTLEEFVNKNYPNPETIRRNRLYAKIRFWIIVLNVALVGYMAGLLVFAK